MSYGQKSHVAIAFQSSWDVSNVTSLYHMQHLEESIGANIPTLIDESNKGTFDEGENHGGPRNADGDLTINAKSIPLGVLLRSLMGPATVVTSNAIHTHTFKPRNNDWDQYSANDPLTYFKYMDDGGSATLFYNLNIGALELGAPAGEFMTAKASFIGGNFEQIADIAASYPTGKRFTWDASSVQLGGSANGDLKGLTITINDQLEGHHTLNNSKWPSRVKRSGNRTIEVAGTIMFENQTEYQKFLNVSTQEMIVSFAGPTEIQSGYTDLVVINMPQVSYSDFKPVAGGPGKTEVGFTARAEYHAGSATAIEITLTNTQAIY